MKKLTITAIIFGCLAMSSCISTNIKKDDNMNIKNSLTEEEKAKRIFTPEVMWKISRVGGASLSPDGKSVMYTITDYNMKRNKGYTNIWSIPSQGGVPIQITDSRSNESSIQWSSDGGKIYFLSDRGAGAQIWCAKPDGKEMKRVSEIEGGVDGFGINPQGDKLFYIKKVKVENRKSSEFYPDLPKSNARVYDDLMLRHWNYWDEGKYSHIFIADLKNDKIGESIDIMQGEAWDSPLAPYFDAAEITWNNAGNKLAYTCKKMTGTEYALSTDSDIFIYDTESKTTVNITEEMPGYEKYPVFSPDDSMIAFCSMERAGNESDKNRLFVMDFTTGEKHDLTKDFEHSASNIIWGDNETLYFISPIEATIQICSVTRSGKEPVRIITKGMHDINSFVLRNGTMVADIVSLSSPDELFTVNTSDGTLTRLTNTNEEIYNNIKMGEVQKRWVTTTDNKQMLTWVVLPPDFDSTKKYPTLLYCQGGPQSVVSQFWSYRWNLQLMAAQGYIVVAPNRRGVPSFGQEWLDQISGDYSGQNIKDYLSAIDDVSLENWVDKERLGCVGASYGGYSVFFLAGHHQKRFKAFIAHCGMFNLESMYGSTEELWFPNNDLGGPYWSDNPTAKRSYANSPHKFVQNWDTPILIFVGEKDYRIPYTESLQAFTAARLRGLPSRLVIFEDEGHQVFKPQNSLLWNREFFAWLDKYLKN